MFIHPMCPACFPILKHLAFSAGIQVYDITYFTSAVFGKSCNLNELCVKLHLTTVIFLNSEQYVHLPNQVHMVGFSGIVCVVSGGYFNDAFVSMSLRFDILW